MAKLNTVGIDSMLTDLAIRGEKADSAMKRMLIAAADATKQEWKNAAGMHGHVRTGAMIGSIGYKQPKKIQGGDGYETAVYPQGTDADGTRNAEKAYILHYGTSRISGDHWVDEAEENAEAQAQGAMEEIWNELIEG